MNIKELKNFANGIEKNSGFGGIVRRLFKRSKKPLSLRMRESGKNLLTTGSIIGAIGVGGVGYNAIKHGPPLNKEIMNRGY